MVDRTPEHSPAPTHAASKGFTRRRVRSFRVTTFCMVGLTPLFKDDIVHIRVDGPPGDQEYTFTIYRKARGPAGDAMSGDFLRLMSEGKVARIDD